jgi:signal transduction histidine kinase
MAKDTKIIKKTNIKKSENKEVAITSRKKMKYLFDNNLAITLIRQLQKIQSETKDKKTCSFEIQSLFSEFLNLTENQYFFYSNKLLSYEQETNSSDKFIKTIYSFEESGILEWTIEKDGVSIIPNMNIDSISLFTKVLIIPIRFSELLTAFFCASIQNSEMEIALTDFELLQEIVTFGALILKSKDDDKDSDNNINSTIILRKIIEIAPLLISSKVNNFFRKNINAIHKNIDAHLKFALTNEITMKRRIELALEKLEQANNIVKLIEDYSIPKSSWSKTELIDAVELINNILNDFSPLFEQYEIQQNIFIELNEDNKIANIYGNKQVLTMIFAEIIINSIEAMQNGGILNIKITENERKKISITFIDNGVGIQQEFSELIFHPFFTTKLGNENIGLGLYFVKHQLSKYNARIAIFSEENKGTTVKLLFNKFAK